jgi:hypothetical protein
MRALGVKFSLTVDQVLRLLRICGELKLSPSDQFNHRRMHMMNDILALRVVQALLAVTVTAASAAVLQLAMVVG